MGTHLSIVEPFLTAEYIGHGHVQTSALLSARRASSHLRNLADLAATTSCRTTGIAVLSRLKMSSVSNTYDTCGRVFDSEHDVGNSERFMVAATRMKRREGSSGSAKLLLSRCSDKAFAIWARQVRELDFVAQELVV